MAVAIVQQVYGQGPSPGPGRTNLPSPVTAGNLLILAGSGITAATHINIATTTTQRVFTPFVGSVYQGGSYDALTLFYRIATGDEQDLDYYASDCKMYLYEISGASSSPATFATVSKNAQTASAAKSLGALASGDLEIMCFTFGNSSNAFSLNQVVASGWTQDVQYAFPAPIGGGVKHPGFLVAHDAGTDTPALTSGSGSCIWAGIAVGITAGVAFTADFSGTPVSGAAPLAVTFTDLTIGTPTAWSWDFGDGGTSSSQNPSHTYTVAGTYTVTLIASKTGATSTATHTNYVVAAPTAAAGVYIDWDDDGFGTGFYDDVSSDVMGWRIDVGAGPQITGGAQPGSMTLTLKNTSNRYNPFNASSPLYGLLRDGVRVWVGINSDGKLTGSDPRGLFAGRITDITPIAVGGASVAPTVEIVCEDFLGWASRIPVNVDYAEGRSHDALRELALLFAGETRFSLDDEIETMPLSHVDANLRYALDALNGVNGTRHYAKPANNFTDWFTYRTRNRFWRLDGTIDASLDAGSQHVTSTDGWRMSADTVVNEQRAIVEPVVFTAGDFVVWEADKLPLDVTVARPFDLWINFDDVVRDGVLNIASSGATITSQLTMFATTAHLTLSVASGTGTVTALGIQGRLARRAPSESYVADDVTSQGAPRGIRAGADISGEYLGVLAEARGIAAHVVWRYSTPQANPTLTVENWFPDQFERQPYDIVGFTSSQLSVSAQLFEIVGITHTGIIAADAVQYHTTRYVLRESRVQSDPGWFTLDDSLLDATDVLHY